MEAGIRVPASEVPNPCHWISPAECTYTHYYERSDSGASVTDPGTVNKAYSTGEIDCNNCNDPNNTMECSQTLEASFTESLSVSVNSAITVGGPIIEAELGNSIGSEQGRAITLSITCGGSVGPCSRSKYKAYQSARLGKKAEVTHTYTCFIETKSGPNPPCNVGNVASQSGGTRKSTANGNVGSQSGGCESEAVGCQ